MSSVIQRKQRLRIGTVLRSWVAESGFLHWSLELRNPYSSPSRTLPLCQYHQHEQFLWSWLSTEDKLLFAQQIFIAALPLSKKGDFYWKRLKWKIQLRMYVWPKTDRREGKSWNCERETWETLCTAVILESKEELSGIHQPNPTTWYPQVRLQNTSLNTGLRGKLGLKD